MKLGLRGQDASRAVDERGFVPCGEIRRKQNRSTRCAELVGALKQGGKVALEAEGFARAAAAEGGWVKDDGIEGFAPLDQASEVGRNILGNEAVAIRRHPVEFEIPATALER